MGRPGRFVVFLALTGGLACGGKHLDLGQQGDGGGGDEGGTTDGGVSGSDGSGSGDAPVNPLSGTYKGYIESFMFMDGSDTVVMNLTFAGDGTVSGSVLLGNAPLYPPPTDPNVGYPPGLHGSSSNVDLREGFTYSIVQGTYAPPRVTLEISEAELWKKWCELQTTVYPRYSGESDGGCGNLVGYGCLPSVGFSMGTTCTWTSCDHPTPTTIDCGKLYLCDGMGLTPCTCTMTSCTVSLSPSGHSSFDMQLAGAALDGTTTWVDSQLHNVHLTRQ